MGTRAFDNPRQPIYGTTPLMNAHRAPACCSPTLVRCGGVGRARGRGRHARLLGYVAAMLIVPSALGESIAPVQGACFIRWPLSVGFVQHPKVTTLLCVENTHCSSSGCTDDAVQTSCAPLHQNQIKEQLRSRARPFQIPLYNYYCSPPLNGSGTSEERGLLSYVASLSIPSPFSPR